MIIQLINTSSFKRLAQELYKTLFQNWFFVFFFAFRWREYDGTAQLLGDLCRQITQKERKKQVNFTNNNSSISYNIKRILTPSIKKLYFIHQPIHEIVVVAFIFFFYFTLYLFSYHKAIIQNEVESVRKHIETVDNFWGRPGLIIIFQIM